MRNKLETMIELLDAIDIYRKRIEMLRESINGYGAYFPSIVERMRHEKEIYRRVILRLQSRINKIKIEL